LSVLNHAFTPEVLEDEKMAHDFGISGVPMMLLRADDAPWEEAVPLQGAVPYENMHAAMKQLTGE
jgi:predicted DsbA family dithiol-disulfide isomerase